MSPESIRILNFFNKDRFSMAANQLPEWIDAELCDYLVKEGYLSSYYIVPVGQEVVSVGPKGLLAYRLAPAGREMIWKYNAENKRRFTNDVWTRGLSIIAIIISIIALLKP